MKMYRLHSKQVLPITQGEAWDFLSNPANLKVITPDHMGFEILVGDSRQIFPGQIIQYKVSPFPFYTTKWITEITHLKEGEYFVDEQRFGPYAFWHHKHFLKTVDKGVEMEDIIDYKIPFGVIGQMAHPIFVQKQLKQIFSYREKKLVELFGKVNDLPSILELRSI